MIRAAIRAEVRRAITRTDTCMWPPVFHAAETHGPPDLSSSSARHLLVPSANALSILRRAAWPTSLPHQRVALGKAATSQTLLIPPSSLHSFCMEPGAGYFVVACLCVMQG